MPNKKWNKQDLEIGTGIERTNHDDEKQKTKWHVSV